MGDVGPRIAIARVGRRYGTTISQMFRVYRPWLCAGLQRASKGQINMAKIAAIIVPAGRSDQLPDFQQRLGQSLSFCSSHRIETQTYHGLQSACTLLRVAPDPLNPEQQPAERKNMAGVACGYYLSADQAAGDSAQRLISDIALGGTQALPRADGVFAFAGWDKSRERLLAGVDKLGMRPLYWLALPGGGYAVASEVKALASLTDEMPNTNWVAWEEQLTFGFVFGEHTLFEGIMRFGVAQSITFRHNGYASETVEHFLETIEIEERPKEAFVQEQAAVFDEAMSQLAGLYDAKCNTMLTLSGGFDSRRALAWLLKQDIRPRVYTVPEVRMDGREFESEIVRELCRAKNLECYAVYPSSSAEHKHMRHVRDLATDFESDEHGFSTILAMGVSCHDRVNFDGLGAGSQLSGAFMTRQYFGPGGQDRFIARLMHSDRVRKTWLRLPEHNAPPLFQRLCTELERWGDNPNRFAYFYLLSRTRREISLAPLSIQANIFESLCPYLERGMMRSALSFPPEQKVDANIQMPLIRALDPELDRIPSSHSRDILDLARYRIDMSEVERGARLTLLRETSRSGPVIRSSLSMKQRLRFRAAKVLAILEDHSRLRWEFDKAAKIGQLAHFEKISRSPASYRSAVASLGDAIGQYPQWCKTL